MSLSFITNQIAIDNYFSGAAPAETDANWLFLPEIPDTDEIASPSNSEVCDNRIDSNWPSKEEYLHAQYEFLREESTFALRRAVDLVKQWPYSAESDLKDESPGIGIYEKVFVTGITLAKTGLAVRMCFSTFRTGVKIDWLSSKRLKAGSLIAISPVRDRFKTFVIGVVAARPLFLVNDSPPAIDIYFPHPEETLLDPAIEYVILEETSSFFEAQRHNMLAIQRMTKERTTLQQYVITPQQHERVSEDDLIELASQTDSLTLDEYKNPDIRAVGTPRYVRDDPVMDLVSATGIESDCEFNVLGHYLPSESMYLDHSQMKALHQILTKEMALIQGPPGTGKTHVSVMALAVMLRKMDEQRRNASPDEPVPPIIVACQTNHALDQLLRHVAEFEEAFVRLGGRSADRGVVRRHTLFEIQQNLPQPTPPKALRDTKKALLLMEKDFKRILAPFDGSKEISGPMDEDSFRDLLSEKQIDSLRNSKWQTSGDSDLTNASAIIKWLGQDAAMSDSTSKWVREQEFGFESFEAEEELVDQAAAEKGAMDDKIEMVRGPFIPLVDRSILAIHGKQLAAQDVKKLLRKVSDLTKIPAPIRRQLYVFLVQDAKKKIFDKVRGLASNWAREVKRHRIGNFASKLEILQTAKIIGLTITGFAKYRPMIYALKPRIVLIEEAGECLEANMCNVFLPSLQHLVLVGDHQQLRPRAQKANHNRLHYDISLFERLANNTVDYRMLAVQRRMPPEVRRLLWPIYEDRIVDHESVLHRPAVPGMGGNKTFFFHHEELETQDKFKSSLNEKEAEKVVEFVNNLVHNGTEPEKITVLTFYNGQRRLIARKLNSRDEPKGFKVVTVDSYQGEENDVIVLSLVRSNFSKTVGFLSVANRVCVALSRARRGLYLFGNVSLLEEAGGPEWQQVIAIMRGKGPAETRFVGNSKVVRYEWAEACGLGA